MNCPGCGAATRLAGNRRHLVCEHCGRAHFPEETADGVAVLDTNTELNCPLCNVALCDALIEAECVVYCVQCRGFLARNAAFGRIVNRRRCQNKATSNSHEPFNPDELRRQINCPQCNRRMETHAFGGGGNAVVDTCPRCDSIWLDAEELTIIGRYAPHVSRREPISAVVNMEDDRAPSLLDWFGG